jgi:hypothetical protein
MKDFKNSAMKNSRIVYYDSFSIAVINPNGELRRIYCPFMVKCKRQVDNIQENSMVYVEEVCSNVNGLLFYRIGLLFYKYDDFSLKSRF